LEVQSLAKSASARIATRKTFTIALPRRCGIERLRAKILAEFGVVKMAIGEPIYDNYQILGRMLNSTVRAEERTLLKRVQEKYDVTALVIVIQRQLNGEFSDDKNITSEFETV
jgi:hypothetical protein